MKKHRLIAAALISLLTFGSAQTTLAEVFRHDINDINSEEKDFVITGKNDTHIFFTSEENKTLNYSIIVNDGVTKIVLQGVNIKTTDKSGISIGSGANVVLELVGENSITVKSGDYYYEAGINVANGTLTITGGNSGSLNVAVENDKNINYAAAIGANGYDDFTGKINVEGGKIKATSSFGAGIGSGYFGDMFGTITISGGKVEASSAYSAGIGSGYRGEMSGSIAISGGEVTASSERGAGIGAGDTMSGTGTITISGGEVTASSSSNGAGIGSGLYGEMSGNINISGGKVNATSKYDAGIGSGAEGNMSGTITISGGEVTASSTGDGAGIGSGAEFVSGIAPEMSGTIAISGGKVTASSTGDGAGIGSGKNGNIAENDSITIGGDATVTANSEAGSGIGSGDSGNMNGDIGNMNGTITITDDAKVDITLGDTSNNTGIGAGEISSENPYYKFNGSINILEHANVNMIYSDPYDPDYEGVPNIGSINPDSTGGITLSTGATINGTQASDVEALKELGILNDNAVTTTVEPTPEPVEPEVKPDSRNTYSLKQLNLVQRINEAEGGEVVAVSEKQLSKGKLPAYALEALAKKENVTLAILCEKFDILIPSDEAVKDAGSTQFYTIDELVEMYE